MGADIGMSFDMAATLLTFVYMLKLTLLGFEGFFETAPVEEAMEFAEKRSLRDQRVG